MFYIFRISLPTMFETLGDKQLIKLLLAEKGVTIHLSTDRCDASNLHLYIS